MKKLSLVVALSLLALMPSRAEKFVIMHTNDTHSQIDPANDGFGGVARRKVLIDSIRSANKASLLVDAGDIVQGTVFFNAFKGEVEEKLMNALGYDIRILGNHEFDNGLDILAKNLSTAQAELLASNYGMRGTALEPFFKPYTLREVGGKRIAFMPVNLDPDGMISAGNYAGIAYTDPYTAANNLAWYLKNILQADYVVAVSHIGYTDPEQPNDIGLVESSTDIDLVIGGHTHTVIDPAMADSPAWTIKNAAGRLIPVTQTGNQGRYLGEITIDTDKLDALPAYRLIPVDGRLDSRVDPAITALIDSYRPQIEAMNSNYIAKTSRLLPRKSEDMLNFASDFIAARGRELADNIDFSLLNQGGLRNDLPKGDISEGNIVSLMPFFNRIEVIEISGDSLLKSLPIMARNNVRGVSAEVSGEYDPETYEFTTFKINGKNIDPARTYRIATIDYVADGGDRMSPFKTHRLVARSENIMFDDMLNYLRSGKMKIINPSPKARIAKKK